MDANHEHRDGNRLRQRRIPVNVENCILVDDSSAGAQSGIDAGMEVFYFCADPHNKPIVHPKVTTFTELAQLPALWKARGWNITR
ncbi:hypothetical protein AWF30_18435 [Escherichia coli]|nr:hypothetical protein AWF30_18435 [Escherichia coli]